MIIIPKLHFKSLNNFIIKFLQVDEGEKPEDEWTKEEYQCVLEKYKEKVNQVNELLEKLNK